MALGVAETLRIIITGDGSAAVAEFKKVGGAAASELGKAEGSAAKVGASLSKAGLGMLATGGVLLAGAKKFSEAAEESNFAEAKLNNTLKNAPQLAGSTSKAFLDLAKAQQKVTVISDEEFVSAEALLGQMGLTENQITTLIPLIADYARKTGKDMATAAADVGKSVEGKNKALVASLGAFDSAAYKADHYGETLRKLNEGVAGFAHNPTSVSAQLKMLGNDLNDTAEEIGQGAIPALQSMVGGLRSLAGAYNGLPSGIKGATGGIMAWGGAALVAAGATSVVGGQLIKLGTMLRLTGGQMAGLSVGIVAVAAAWGVYQSRQKEVHDMAVKVNEDVSKKFDSDNVEQASDRLGRVKDQLKDIDSTLAGSSNWAFWDADYRSQLEDMRQQLTMTAIGETIAQAADEARAKALGVSVDVVRAAREAEEKKTKATKDGKDATDDATDEVKDYNTEISKIGDAYDDARKGMSDYWDAAFNKLDTSRRHGEAVREAQQAAYDIVQAGGSVWDWNRNQLNMTTDAGRELVEKIEDIAKTGLETVAQITSERGIPAGKKAFDDLTKSTYDTLIKMGLTDSQAQILMGSLLHLTEHDWETSVRVNTSEAEAKIQALYDKLTGIGYSPTAAAHATGQFGGASDWSGSSNRSAPTGLTRTAAPSAPSGSNEFAVISMDGQVFMKARQTAQAGLS